MKDFWNSYYIVKKKISKPSNFAKYCLNNFFILKKKLLEFGCGDGRDSFFFYKHKLSVCAIDKSQIIIHKNLAKINNKNIKFYKKDVVKDYLGDLGKFDYLYARFFLHTINLQSEKLFFKKILKLGIKNKTLIFLEFRTIKDPLLKLGKKISRNETFTDHYRRFIDTKELIKKIRNNKRLKILKFIERKGLARFKKENPVVCRLILKIV
jgi:tellurite methyltransferase